MTVKLYDEQPYEIKFTATVASCEKADDKACAGTRYGIVLDQTLFFPEEGGQTPDLGVLIPQTQDPGDLAPDQPGADGPTVNVLDVQIEGDTIIHYCDRQLDPGTEVTGKIDWARRFDNMQQHTGEHIVSGLVHKHFGYENVGFHLSKETVTMDYDGELSPGQIDRLEKLANEAIWEDRRVTARYPEAAELAGLDYRSKLDLTEGVRLVEIEGIDLCACCAPHVCSTAQVGLLKITDYRRYKGGMRLWIVCGGRALADYSVLHEQALALSGELSSPRGALAEPVRALKSEIEAQKAKLRSLSASLLSARIKDISSDQKNVVLFDREIADEKSLRDAVNELSAARDGYCVVFFAPASDGSEAVTWRYICASKGSDCRAWNEALKGSFPVRGGGGESMVQGSVTADEAALQIWFEHEEAI